jgi:hypothetical protein
MMSEWLLGTGNTVQGQQRMRCIFIGMGQNRGPGAMVRRRPARHFGLLFALTIASAFAVSSIRSQDTIFAKLGILKERPTCFLNVVHHPQARKIAEATVFIAMVRTDGTVASEGTGFLVSGSSADDAPAPRIVTAAHVVDDVNTGRNGQRLAVFFSDGMYLGAPRIVALGTTRNLSAGGFDLVANDLAVLEIASFDNQAARRRFLALDGLPLSGGDEILVGETSRPVGATWGFSGAAAIDPAGRVVGVVTGADFRDRTTLALASILDTAQSGGAVPRPVTLPNRSLVIVEPLQSTEILRALGRSPKPRQSAPRTTVNLVGFPLASCAATSATVVPINTEVGTRLFSQWRSAGMDGAWYLPPPLGTAKILPTVGTALAGGKDR